MGPPGSPPVGGPPGSPVGGPPAGGPGVAEGGSALGRGRLVAERVAFARRGTGEAGDAGRRLGLRRRQIDGGDLTHGHESADAGAERHDRAERGAGQKQT